MGTSRDIISHYRPSWLRAFFLYALYAFGIKSPLAGKILDHAGVEEIVWNQKENYANNGLALAFTLNVKNSIVQKPDTYSEQVLQPLQLHLQEAECKSRILKKSVDY